MTSPSRALKTIRVRHDGDLRIVIKGLGGGIDSQAVLSTAMLRMYLIILPFFCFTKGKTIVVIGDANELFQRNEAFYSSHSTQLTCNAARTALHYTVTGNDRSRAGLELVDGHVAMSSVGTSRIGLVGAVVVGTTTATTTVAVVTAATATRVATTTRATMC